MNIALVPIGKIDIDVLNSLKEGIKAAFGKEVAITGEIADPVYALDKKRGQYVSTAILNRIMDLREFDKYERVLAVVDRDLYAEGLNFVFGEAGSKAAVISLTRLKEEFYGLQEDRWLFFRRALTEAVHELGHTYGLKHCYNTGCVMFFSDSIANTDRKGTALCASCAGRLKTVGA